MKKNYMVSLIDTAKQNVTAMKLSVVTAAMVAVPSICAFAAVGDPVTGTSLLSGETLAAVQKGFLDLSATGTQVVGLSIVAAVGVIGISAGANYAIKKVKGVLSKAA